MKSKQNKILYNDILVLHKIYFFYKIAVQNSVKIFVKKNCIVL